MVDLTCFQHALPGEAFDFSEEKLPKDAAVPIEEFTESILFEAAARCIWPLMSMRHHAGESP